jgi:5-methylcytosine-specific restriction endonuclease McrA
MGATSSANLALACFGCNSAKGAETTALDPIMKTVVPFYRPGQGRWGGSFSLEQQLRGADWHFGN